MLLLKGLAYTAPSRHHLEFRHALVVRGIREDVLWLLLLIYM